MSEHRRAEPPVAGGEEDLGTSQHPGHGGGGHRWMMVVCCIPMIALAVWLVVAGVAGSGVVLVALLCLGLMGLMMLGMGHGEGHR